MVDHKNLRLGVKLACIFDKDISMKDFADYIGITHNAFYNYMSGYYDISEKKAIIL